MSKLTIFDADSIIFTVAWKFRTKKVSNLVKINVNKFISDVLANTGADDYIGFYGSKEDGALPNYRYDIAANYKANRPETPDFVKKWGDVIRNEFKETWGFLPVEGMEADDAVAIAVNKHKGDYDEIFVATFDKDLKQIPNTTWYNMRNHTTEIITYDNACRYFYTQLLMGDSTDNIPGLPGVGKVNAKKILKDCTTQYSMFRTVVMKYITAEQALKEKILKDIITNIKEDLAKDEDAVSEYKGLSEAKLRRKIRINTKQSVIDGVNAVFNGGWKTYYKQQYDLLFLLTEPINSFVIPNVIANTVSPKTTTIKTVDNTSMDEFLTI